MKFMSSILGRVLRPLAVAAFFVAFTSSAHADPVTITLIDPVRAGTIGTVFSFSGTITNTNTLPFTFIESRLRTVPVSGGPFSGGLNPVEVLNLFLPGGATTPTIPLFTVSIDVQAVPGTYTLEYTIVGLVGNSVVITTPALFTITVLGENEPAPVPEPATLILLGAGLSGLGVIYKRRR